MLPPTGKLTQALTFMSCMLLPEPIPLFFSPLDPYVLMLYWFLDLAYFCESIEHDYIRI